MPPTHASYRELQGHYEEDVDYKISESPVRSNACVLSPHGGGIEPGVSELVRGIAGGDFSWYLFEGIRKTDNWDLHLTSHYFDEPRAVTFVGRHRVAIAIHGECEGDCEATYLGGRNIRAKELFGNLLRRAGFNVPGKIPSSLLGRQPKNICNRCISGKGVQLEITRGQRERFFCGDFRKRAERKHRTVVFTKYVDTLRAVLRQLDKDSILID